MQEKMQVVALYTPKYTPKCKRGYVKFCVAIRCRIPEKKKIPFGLHFVTTVLVVIIYARENASYGHFYMVVVSSTKPTHIKIRTAYLRMYTLYSPPMQTYYYNIRTPL